MRNFKTILIVILAVSYADLSRTAIMPVSSSDSCMKTGKFSDSKAKAKANVEFKDTKTGLALGFVRIMSDKLPDNVEFYVERNRKPKNKLMVAIIPKGTSVVGPEFELTLGKKELFNSQKKLVQFVVPASGFSVFEITLTESVVIDAFAWVEWKKTQGKQPKWTQAPKLSIKSCRLRGK